MSAAENAGLEAGRLELRQVRRNYDIDGQRLRVLDGIDLAIAPGELVSIVGPSGCGKSTLLRLIVGLDDDYEGDILLDGRRIAGTSLSRGIVFQDHRLLPWMTLEQNVALGLENARASPRQKRERVAQSIDRVGLLGFEAAFPHQLSGGMAQRAAIARGIVAKPEILLLDEPLGALDALTRMRLQDELLRIWQHEKITMVLVTHDVEEAVYLANRVVVMHPRPGSIVETIEIDLPYPRDRASHALADLRRQILLAMGALSDPSAVRNRHGSPV